MVFCQMDVQEFNLSYLRCAALAAWASSTASLAEAWLYCSATLLSLSCITVHHRLNMELDLQSLFGLMCIAVLIG
jgi:hypothetical protein